MLLDLAQNDGLMPKRKTPLEYGSACPFCGGNDRFVIFAEENKYWCRQCGKSGDSIQYLRELHGMSFPDAARQVGKDVVPSGRVATPVVKPPKKEQPGEWHIIARKFIGWANRKLIENAEALAWLRTERGIMQETATKFNLGWSDHNVFRAKEEWGIEPDGKKLFIPSGLIIPWQDKRIRVRRDNPGEYARYHVVKNSNSAPYTIGSHYETTAIVVESELDAILLAQEIQRKVFIVALGSCSIKPDETLLEKLADCPVILVALDTDGAGGKASQWWIDNVSGCYRTLTPKAYGKDITEAFLNGLDLNDWLIWSMELCCEDILKDHPYFAEEKLIEELPKVV